MAAGNYTHAICLGAEDALDAVSTRESPGSCSGGDSDLELFILPPRTYMRSWADF